MQTLLQAALFAAAVALLVWLLPGKLPVALLSLYCFICVGLLQLGATAILLLALVRALFSADARRDVVKAGLICGGFVIVVALCPAPTEETQIVTDDNPAPESLKTAVLFVFPGSYKAAMVTV